jgi:non-heme chloroperoxidase
MKTHKSICSFLSLVLLIVFCNASAGEYVRVSPDLELYYVEAGTGTPMIFIPGWCGTTEFFEQYQIPYFSKNYRAICYDPRSQGRSSKTSENNNYTQHGKDLRAFMEVMELKDVILVGHSAGCHDIYAYLREYGTDNVKSCIFIDYMPRPIAAEKGDWAEFSDATEVGDFINAIIYDFHGLMTAFMPTVIQREMRQDELDWILDQIFKTPIYAAALLGVDVSFADYTAEVQMIDGKIPVLNVVSEWREGWAESAQNLLTINSPNSEIFVLGNHMMFFEFPKEFNAEVDAFLTKIK